MARPTTTGAPKRRTRTEPDTSARTREDAPPRPPPPDEPEAPDEADDPLALPALNEVVAGAGAAAALALPKGLPRRQRAFLIAFAVTANVSRACAAAGVARSTVYAWKAAEGPAGDRYRVAFTRARQVAGDVLEAQAWKLAVEGTLRPIVSKGEVVTYVREYEPSVLLRLLEAHRPRRYRPRVGLEHDIAPGFAERLKAARARAAAGRPAPAVTAPAEAARRSETDIDGAGLEGPASGEAAEPAIERRP